MDYQPTNQPINPQPMNQPTGQSVEQGSSDKMWYLIGAIVVIAALALWYYSKSSSEPLPSTVGTEASSDTAAASLSAELEQIPDDSAALNQEASASAATVQAF